MTDALNLSVTHMQLLLRYLAGETTPRETEDVIGWIALRPEHAHVLAALERAFEIDASVIEGGPEAISSVDAVWERLAARLPEGATERASARPLVLEPAAPVTPPVTPARSPFAPGMVRAGLRAAAVLIAVGAGVMIWRTTGSGAFTAFVGRQAVSAYREYVTRPGERASFTLADGTQVVLGVASRLRVPSDYGHASRDVTLDGEAYFDVHHDPARRFRVRSTHSIAEDIGTRFDVRDYAEDTVAQVVVAEGEVALRSGVSTAASKPLVLVAGDVGHASAGGTVVAHNEGDVSQYLTWLEGRLVLRNVALRDALPQLSRWYDLDFRLGDSTLATTRLTGTLTSQPIAGTLDLLAVTLGVRIERHGRTATFYAQTAPPVP